MSTIQANCHFSERSSLVMVACESDQRSSEDETEPKTAAEAEMAPQPFSASADAAAEMAENEMNSGLMSKVPVAPTERVHCHESAD